jgi:hypothetical protein
MARRIDERYPGDRTDSDETNGPPLSGGGEPDIRLKTPAPAGDPEADPNAGGVDPTGRSGETPRERPMPGAPGGGGNLAGPQSGQATPDRPMYPAPTGGAFQAPAPQGVVPFQPMSSPMSGGGGRLNSLFGSLGGSRGAASVCRWIHNLIPHRILSRPY